MNKIEMLQFHAENYKKMKEAYDQMNQCIMQYETCIYDMVYQLSKEVEDENILADIISTGSSIYYDKPGRPTSV